MEEGFNDEAASCHSIKEGIHWMRELLSEYKSCFDLVFFKGTVQHIKVPLVEDDDGDTKEDWNGDLQYLESAELEWSDNNDDDDDDDNE